MSEEEREELLAAIYGNNDDDDEVEKAAAYDPLKSSARSFKVNVDGRSVEIPNMGYVLAMERTIVQMAADLKKMAIMIETTRKVVSRMGLVTNTNTRNLNRQIIAIEGQMDNKIDNTR